MYPLWVLEKKVLILLSQIYPKLMIMICIHDQIMMSDSFSFPLSKPVQRVLVEVILVGLWSG